MGPLSAVVTDTHTTINAMQTSVQIENMQWLCWLVLDIQVSRDVFKSGALCDEHSKRMHMESRSSDLKSMLSALCQWPW